MCCKLRPAWGYSELKTSLNCIVRPWLKKSKTNKQKQKPSSYFKTQNKNHGPTHESHLFHVSDLLGTEMHAIISALSKMRHKNLEFEVTLGYTMSLRPV